MNEEQESSITLADLFNVLKNNIIVVIAATIFGGIIAFILAAFVVTPKYTSTSKMYISTNNDQIINLSDLQTSAALTDDYEVIIKGRNFVNNAFELLTSNSYPISQNSSGESNTYKITGSTYSVTSIDGIVYEYNLAGLIDLVKINNPTNSHILEITMETEDPLFSADFSNSLAAVTKADIYSIIPISEPAVFEYAIPNSKPVSPNEKIFILVGLLIGLVGSYAVCLLLFMFKSSFDNEEDIYRILGIDTLGVISDGANLQSSSSSSKGGTK